jgi:prolyl-tRNA editing enzyme YbaK/EbsC (Cys-tRNA(Pro) deacylase)
MSDEGGLRPLPDSVARVARFLSEARAEARIQEFRGGTPTAEDAAKAVGCELDQIVKSLVFLCDERPVLVMVPGSRRADSRKIAAAAKASSGKIAPAATVKEATGYPVGGVAPFALRRIETVFIDRALLAWKLVWTGAGSDRHMAGIAPAELVRLTKARSIDACAEV